MQDDLADQQVRRRVGLPPAPDKQGFNIEVEIETGTPDYGNMVSSFGNMYGRLRRADFFLKDHFPYTPSYIAGPGTLIPLPPPPIPQSKLFAQLFSQGGRDIEQRVALSYAFPANEIHGNWSGVFDLNAYYKDKTETYVTKLPLTGPFYLNVSGFARDHAADPNSDFDEDDFWYLDAIQFERGWRIMLGLTNSHAVSPKPPRKISDCQAVLAFGWFTPK